MALEPGAPALAKGSRQLALASAWPGDQGLGEAAHLLARRIEAASDGHISITLATSGRTGLDAVRSGDADLYFASENAHVHLEPAFGFFAGLPFFAGLEPIDLEAWVTVGGGQALWDRLAGEFDMKCFLAGHTGRAPGLWCVQPLGGLADLVRAPVATTGLAARVLEQLGGQPVSLRENELRGALERKRIVAAEHAGPAISARLGLPAVAPFHTAFGFASAGTALSLGMRRSVWEDLGGADRAIFQACCAEVFHRILGAARASDAPARAELASQGVVFDTLPASVLSALASATDDCIARVASMGRHAREIHASYMGFRKALASGPIAGRHSGPVARAG